MIFVILFRSAQIKALAQICSHLSDYVEHEDNFTGESIYKVIEDLAPNHEYTIQECRWQQQQINCSKYISSILTLFGHCFVFNALNFYEMYTDV